VTPAVCGVYVWHLHFYSTKTISAWERPETFITIQRQKNSQCLTATQNTILSKNNNHNTNNQYHVHPVKQLFSRFTCDKINTRQIDNLPAYRLVLWPGGWATDRASSLENISPSRIPQKFISGDLCRTWPKLPGSIHDVLRPRLWGRRSSSIVPSHVRLGRPARRCQSAGGRLMAARRIQEDAKLTLYNN